MMSARRYFSALLGCIAVGTWSQSSDSQSHEALEEFSNPEFWSIVAAGPANSDELQRVVGAYAANDMHEPAIEALQHYLQEDRDDQDPYCTWCIALVKTVNGPAQDDQVEYFFAAADRLLAQAHEQQSGERLLSVAEIFARSNNSAVVDRGIYFIVAAIRFGVEDISRLTIVRLLAEFGRMTDALTLAAAAFADETSAHYQSDAAQEWIEYLDKEVARSAALSAAIASAR